ncbi:uncharacterized protein V1513DRAFT_461902 [Lipomyces chichibuensis]|uniref:uncharacterized protein n=1 Tax=Lipomyces chichibuensis TaxID=1546026 RepID=UPI003343CC47
MPELSAKDLFEKDLSLRSPFPRGNNVSQSSTPTRPARIGPPMFAPPKPGSGFKPPTSATKLIAPSARRPSVGDANNKLQKLFYQSPMPRISNPGLARYNLTVSSPRLANVAAPVNPSYTSATSTPGYNNSWKSTPPSVSNDNFRHSPPPRQIQPVALPPQVPPHVPPQQNEPMSAPLPVPTKSATPQDKVPTAAPDAPPKSRSLGFRIGDLISLVSGVRHSAEPEKSPLKEASPVQRASTDSEGFFAEKDTSTDIQMDNAPSDSQSLSSNSSLSSTITPSSASSTTNAHTTEGLLPSASITKRTQKNRMIAIPEPLPQLNSIGIYESRASSASPIVSLRRKVKKRPTSPGRAPATGAKALRGRGVQRGRRGRSSFTERQVGQNGPKPATKSARRSLPKHSSPSTELESDSDELVDQYESQEPQMKPVTPVPESGVQEIPDSEPESASPENAPAPERVPRGQNIIIETEGNEENVVRGSQNAESSVTPPVLSALKRARRLSRALPEEQPSRRSGRTRVKPLEYWRNERIVYCLVHDDARGDVVPSIRHIVRAEDDGADHSGTGKKRRRSVTS